MIQLPLTIRPSRQPLRPPAAWLIPGGDPRAWLEELIAWQTPLAGLTLYLVPTSSGDVNPCGVLVVPPSDCRPHPTLRSQPYGRLAGRLYLPVEARFDPDVCEPELERQLGESIRVYLWHPAVGLIGYEADDALGVADLLEPPAERPASWDRAQPGVAVHRRLTGVLPSQTPSLQQIFEQGQEDIGSQPPEADGLPPSPREPTAGTVHALGRAAGKQVARAVQWLAEHAPQPGAAPAWLEGLRQWARRQLAQADEALEATRNRAILRLLNLLETRPDEGLRFAPPVEQGGGHRGLGRPSGELARHGVDFDLGALGGGRPGDPWCVPYDLHQQLVALYRQLADREIRLGRFRRAAYIFAHLLGDFTAAANVLGSGGHWREAAVLYRDKLSRPDEAIRCLEQGGLLSEAVALCEQINAYERAGDLYTRMEQPDNAQRAYRQAVALLLGTSGDRLAVARLLEEKLHAPEEALAQLESGWPNSPQALRCLQESFRLLAKLGRHEAARRKIESLIQEPLSGQRAAPVADLLAEQSRSYPDDDARASAADAVRVIVAPRLPSARAEDVRQMLAAVARLAPQDRLLDRDCARFQRGRPATPKPPSPRRTGRRRELRLVREIPVLLARRGFEWRAAVSTWQTFYAAARRDPQGEVHPHGDAKWPLECLAGAPEQTLTLVRCAWNEVDPHFRLSVGAFAAARGPVLLAPDPRDTRPVVVHVAGAAPLPIATLAATDAMPSSIEAGTPAWLPQSTIGIARTLHGMTWAATLADDGLVVYAFGPDGQLDGSRTVRVGRGDRDPDCERLVVPLPMFARENAVYLGLGDQFLAIKPAEVRFYDFPGVIGRLSGSTYHTTGPLVASLDRGAVAFWDEGKSSHRQTFATELAHPVTGFSRGGWLVAAVEGVCQVYRTAGHSITLEAETDQTGPAPLAVLSPARLDQLALFSSDGIVRVYERS